MSDYRRTGSVSNMLSSLQWSSIESQHKEVQLTFMALLILTAYLHPTFIKTPKGKSFEIHAASSQGKFLKIQLLPCFNHR